MKKLFTLLLLITAFSVKADYWTQKANFPGVSRLGAFSFVINNAGYVGTGENCNLANNQLIDFWKYDPTNNVWTQKANFGGIARCWATGFSIQNKGYAGLGTNGNLVYQDFWKYDPVLNSWTQIANFPVARAAAVSFVIGNLAYVGTGYGTIAPYAHNEFFAYDPNTNTWQQKASIGNPRSYAIAFSIGNKGYLGTGYNNNNSTSFNDFLEYDPVTNTWITKAFFVGQRCEATAFSIGNEGYISTGFQQSMGFTNDIYQYSSTSNTWTQKTAFNGNIRGDAAGFSIGNKGYVGIGGVSGTQTYNDFWEYTPGNVTEVEEFPSSNFQFTIFPNPAHEYANISFPIAIGTSENKNAELLITTLEGKKVYETKLLTSGFRPDSYRVPTSDFPKGIYLVQIISNPKNSATRKLVIE